MQTSHCQDWNNSKISALVLASLAIFAASMLLSIDAATACGPYVPKDLQCACLGPTPVLKQCCSGYCAQRAQMTLAVKTDKGTVFFCCPDCKEKFLKDQKKFAVNVNHQLARTGQAMQRKCPVSGEKIDGKHSCKVAGVLVLVSCENCLAKLNGMSERDRVAFVFADQRFLMAFQTAKQ